MPAYDLITLTIHMKKILLQLFLIVSITSIQAQGFVTEKKTAGALPLIAAGEVASIYVDPQDHAVVKKAAALLQEDLEKISGIKPSLQNKFSAPGKNIIVIGSLDQSSFIRQLAAEKKVTTAHLKGKWEAYEISLSKA